MRFKIRVVLMMMSRFSIVECEYYPFQVPMEVRVTDLNYATHMGADQLLGQAHQVRYLFFKSLGIHELDFGDGHTGVAISDVGVVCQKEVFLGDRLLFQVGVRSIGRSSFRLGFKVTREDSTWMSRDRVSRDRVSRDRVSRTCVALIEKGCVAFDYEKSRPVRLPASVKEKLLECQKVSKIRRLLV